MPKYAKKQKRPSLLFQLSKLDKKKFKAKKKRMKAKKSARLTYLRLNKTKDDKTISEDECDFDFDRSTRPLCSTSEDDTDGPPGGV